MSSQETLVKYYEALSIGDLDTVADCMDIPSKFISLYGVAVWFFRPRRIFRGFG